MYILLMNEHLLKAPRILTSAHSPLLAEYAAQQLHPPSLFVLLAVAAHEALPIAVVDIPLVP